LGGSMTSGVHLPVRVSVLKHVVMTVASTPWAHSTRQASEGPSQTGQSECIRYKSMQVMPGGWPGEQQCRGRCRHAWRSDCWCFRRIRARLPSLAARTRCADADVQRRSQSLVRGAESDDLFATSPTSGMTVRCAKSAICVLGALIVAVAVRGRALTQQPGPGHMLTQAGVGDFWQGPVCVRPGALCPG
jgi:hypothetical protein